MRSCRETVLSKPAWAEEALYLPEIRSFIRRSSSVWRRSICRRPQRFVANVDNIQSQINNINEIHTNYMMQIAFGKYSGTAEEIVAEYQAALEAAGINDVTAELQAQFDALYGAN